MLIAVVDQLRKSWWNYRKVKQSRYVSIHDIAKNVNIHHQTVSNDLKRENSLDPISICEILPKPYETESSLKRLIAGDRY